MSIKMSTMDGNEAAAYSSYALTEVAAIYPITPSSPMAENVDEWSAHGVKNLFGQQVKVVEMESEAGAAGTVHGSLVSGALTTTYTASQGLLLMIPTMYKIAGELLPCVFHVSARALATHALSIFGDHQDVMACRQTGFALLSSTNVQEALDLGYVAHLATLKARIPFLHFFDGFRTSHEYQKIEVLDQETIRPLVDFQGIENFRNNSLSPEHPVLKGTAQNPDVYFQMREAANPFYAEVPDIVEQTMRDIEKITGRVYHPFNYYGAEDAEYVIVAMGSVCDTIEETVDYLRSKGEKVGVVIVHLYRPFSAKHFFAVCPPTVKRIAVLDRTKEPGAPGEPLYLDIVELFSNHTAKPLIVGGRYGLGSKDTTPSQIIAVFDNLKQQNPINYFTIGIVDDVAHTSLPEEEIVDTTPSGTVSCKFWGLGSDGTVGANKSAVKIIGDNTDLYVQAYFSYDSKKSGGTTVSHLRFGPKPIKSRYLVYNADYIACHNQSFINQYNLVKGLKKNGTFVLNCPWTPEELEEHLPVPLKRYLAQNNISFYIIDAVGIAQELGLGSRINMVMQAAFFKLANIIPIEDAVDYLKKSIEQAYGRKGEKIVNMNKAAVDRALTGLVKVEIPESWANLQHETSNTTDSFTKEKLKQVPDFISKIHEPIMRYEGDELPVSTFKGIEDGRAPLGTTAYEKRGIAVFIPEWQIDKCIQCNQCSYICPHATIRPFLLDQEEKDNAPDTFKTKKAIGKGLEQLHYRIQVDPLDCTGCMNCADICPAPGKALVMKPAVQEIEMEAENWEYALSIKPKEDKISRFTLKGSQFVRPLLEFSGACPGCGETPYVKLLTQLFGERMMIANATGCSSIWGGSFPSIPYSTTAGGRGPAWANSLFENNAEYGYGMYLGVNQLREKLAQLMKQALSMELDDSLKKAFAKWLEVYDDGELSEQASQQVLQILHHHPQANNPVLDEIIKYKDYLVKPSVWAIGGDGWAYDIGYNGVDHVLASGDDINMLVLDTEVYSNTGGQASKATQTAAIAKFAAAGKRIRKKDLGLMAISYGYVYVAQIAMGANMQQTIKAITEAEKYKGPSLIIAYSTCFNHGIKNGMGTSLRQQKNAVEAGYWHLYRYNPDLQKEGKNPFMLDSKEPKTNFQEFLQSEVRYSSLKTVFPEIAEDLFVAAEEHARIRYETYRRLAEGMKV
ncbi:MAG: pyruvate:ferredoxin (flavodoxin) oxidoreductase [Peptococcaceae bacterium]|jgi:pyruvate-ferredoxin/flavodoxin oxidoreductase|nr:pyruvate:ferredoxin (flavodoxin) oxidoreductase [Peptococcaceae bacterium]